MTVSTKKTTRKKVIRELKHLRTAISKAERERHGCRCCRCCRCW